MDKKIQIIIPSSNNEAIEFRSSFVEYAKKRIYYKDVTGLSYYSVKSSVNFIPTAQSYSVLIKDKDSEIKVDLSSSLYIKNKEKKIFFHQFIYIAEQIIKPFLLLNLIEQLENEGGIKIGLFDIKKGGLYVPRFLRKPKFLSWHDYDCYEIQQGFVHVYKKHPRKENSPQLFCSISLNIINAVALPEILEYLTKGDFKKQNAKLKKTIINFCPNCGLKLKESVTFCQQCGKKTKK